MDTAVSRGPDTFSVKMSQEALAVAMTAVWRSLDYDIDQKAAVVNRLEQMHEFLTLLRPVGSNGKHGDRHTPWCGC